MRSAEGPAAALRGLGVAALLVLGCGDAEANRSAAELASPTEAFTPRGPRDAPRPSAPDRVADRWSRCDQDALRGAADELRELRETWSPAVGEPPWVRLAPVAASAIWNACHESLVDELRWYLDLGVHHPTPPWIRDGVPAPPVAPLTALDGLMTEHVDFHGRSGIAGHSARRRAACPRFDDAFARAALVEGAERPGVIYEDCELESRKLFSEQEFTRRPIHTAIGLGAYAVFEFLLEERTPRKVARPLARELLRDTMPESMESILADAASDGLRLPAATTGRPMTPGIEYVVLGPRTVAVGGQRVAETGDHDLAARVEVSLFDANEDAARLGMRTGAVLPTHVSLIAHREAPWSAVQAVLRAARDARFTDPLHLVVLIDDADDPLRVRLLDSTASALPRSLAPTLEVEDALRRLGP